MKPAQDPDMDYKSLVKRSYDRCAQAYGDSRRRKAEMELAWLSESLLEGAIVLDVGCGTGIPITHTLAERFQVVGVDISNDMIDRARNNVPGGEFILGDIMSIDFPPGNFDGIVMFYTLFHLPREEHKELLSRYFSWLKPDGYLLITVTHHREEPYTEADFFDETMFWSNWGLADYKRILEEIGFTIKKISNINHGFAEHCGAPEESHPVIFAQKNSK